MDWIQVGSIIASVIFCAFYLHKEMKEWKKEVREDMHAFREEMINQSLRTDKLYEMFIDLIKEGRK